MTFTTTGRRTLFFVAAFVSEWTLTANLAHAVHPARTALVVNERSLDSLTIANHYAAFRNIPDACIIVLPEVPASMACTIGELKSQILKPLVVEIQNRGLQNQIDLIAYSAGFPTAIKLDSDFAKVPPPHKIFTPVGSLNGMTSLFQFLADDQINYVAPRTNFYSRVDKSLLMENPFLGKASQAFDEATKAYESQDYETAIQSLQVLIKAHPAQWPLRYRLAGFQAASGKTEDALETLAGLLRDGVAFAPLFEDNKSFDTIRGNEEFIKLLAAMPQLAPNRYPPVGFSSAVSWGRNGLAVGDQSGPKYLLSTVLAVTQGRGTTLKEAIECLKRAVSADATGQPSTFYFSNSSDVRSTTRMPLVPVAAVKLRELGHTVIINEARLPAQQDKLMGVMLGSANYEWPLTCTLLPGAIADNLTSTSGVLHEENGQTSMVELLRAGAAGTSGTVTEPYALQFKFPTPLMYAYYAAGATLAEAFYLSVESPYQLLIVGDPLCRPFGNESSEPFRLEVTSDTSTISVQIRYQKPFEMAAAKLSHLELFFSGRLASLAKLAHNININKAGLPPGWHELTLVSVSKHPLQTRTAQSTYVLIGDELNCPLLKAELVKTDQGEAIQLSITAPQATRVAIEHLGRRLVESEETEFRIDLKQVGYGPVRFKPLAQVDGQWIPGKPVTIEIAIPE